MVSRWRPACDAWDKEFWRQVFETNLGHTLFEGQEITWQGGFDKKYDGKCRILCFSYSNTYKRSTLTKCWAKSLPYHLISSDHYRGQTLHVSMPYLRHNSQTLSKKKKKNLIPQPCTCHGSVQVRHFNYVAEISHTLKGVGEEQRKRSNGGENDSPTHTVTSRIRALMLSHSSVKCGTDWHTSTHTH